MKSGNTTYGNNNNNSIAEEFTLTVIITVNF
jgi:hypothetical protein